MRTAAATPPSLVTLVLLSGLSVASLNLFLPSLSNIATDFRADYALVNLSIAGYAAATALLQLVMGPLSDRFGRRPVILWGLAIFLGASAGCLLAPDIETFLLFRMIQGAIVSGHTISMAVVRDSAPAQKAASLLGYLAMAWAIAPMLAPLLGGVLDEIFGWHASFWAMLALGLAVFALCWFDLGETNKNPSKTLWTQFQSYPALISSRRFWGYALCMAFSIGAFYAFLGGAPFVAAALFNMSPGLLGFCMGTITAGFVSGSFVSGSFSARYKLTTMMIAGRLVACGGLTLGLLILSVGMIHPVTLFGACVFVGLGNGITMPSANAGAMSVRPDLAGGAAGLSGALTVAGGGAISAITGLVMTENGAGLALLGMMLLASTLGLGSALAVLWLDRRGARPARDSSNG